jgi:predicted glutamine amidotransferase
MCRLFAMHTGSTPVSATFWLLDAPDSLAAQSHRNPDGAGIGSYDPTGQPVIDKQPLAAWQDREFATAARELRATTFVAHVRYASSGALTAANTHPFLQQGRLFAHNGVVTGLDQLDDRLTELGVRQLVRGETDSERVFALITGEIARHQDDVTEGIGAAIGWIADRLPLYALNLVLATRTELWALRYPATHELYLLERPAGTSRQLHATGQRIQARSAELADSAAVIIASERMDDDPGWRLVEPGELLHVQADLRVTSSSPFRPPRQLLSADQLSPVAAASQHPE